MKKAVPIPALQAPFPNLDTAERERKGNGKRDLHPLQAFTTLQMPRTVHRSMGNCPHDYIPATFDLLIVA